MSLVIFDCSFIEKKKQEELEAEEKEEEEEAKTIQKRLAENLSEEDYDLNFFQVHSLTCTFPPNTLSKFHVCEQN